MTVTKFSSLNLWDIETKAQKFDLDVKQNEVAIDYPRPVKITNQLFVEGVNVKQKLDSLTSDILSSTATAASATSVVQANLDNYTTVNNQSIGLLDVRLLQETTFRETGDQNNMTKRDELESKLDTAIADESIRAKSAEQVLTDQLAQEITDRVSSNTTLTTALDVEKARIDSILLNSDIDLNQLKELVDAYTAADSNLLTQVQNLQDKLTTLEADFQNLTSSN